MQWDIHPPPPRQVNLTLPWTVCETWNDKVEHNIWRKKETYKPIQMHTEKLREREREINYLIWYICGYPFSTSPALKKTKKKQCTVTVYTPQHPLTNKCHGKVMMYFSDVQTDITFQNWLKINWGYTCQNSSYNPSHAYPCLCSMVSTGVRASRSFSRLNRPTLAWAPILYLPSSSDVLGTKSENISFLLQH